MNEFFEEPENSNDFMKDFIEKLGQGGVPDPSDMDKLKKESRKLVDDLLEMYEKGEIPESTDEHKKILDDISKHLLDKIAHLPATEIREWIKDGIHLAFLSKMLDQTYQDFGHSPTLDEEVAAVKKQLALEDENAAEKLCESTMRDIDRNVLESRPVGTYEYSDPMSYLRVFARWLNEYLRLEGEDVEDDDNKQRSK